MIARASAAPSARAAAFRRSALVAALVVGLDQLTKRTIASGIGPGEVRRFLPGIDLVHVRNTGVAFSLFSGGGTIVLVFTLLALAALTGYLALRPDRPGLWLPTGLLVGGAIGNLIDRVADGAVTDFIKLPLWPAFNLADLAITLGVLALLWVFDRRRSDAH
jgi:signal peptidase II